MKRIGLILMLLALAVPCWGATKYIDEDFDDQAIDSRLRVYGNDWAALSPPSYNLTTVGRGGSGYCITSGTVQPISVNWGALGVGSVPNPWPTDEFYVSFWIRYTGVTANNADVNIKQAYPHWNGVNNALEIRSIAGTTGSGSYVFYKNASLVCRDHGTISCGGGTYYAGAYGYPPAGIFDGGWHQIAYYVNMATGAYKLWYDEDLVVEDLADTTLTGQVYYLNAGSIDSDGNEVFTRQIDDVEMWDGMPDSTPAPAPPTLSNVTISGGSFR